MYFIRCAIMILHRIEFKPDINSRLHWFSFSRFVSGHYWILHIKWPEYELSLYAPNRWCHKTLYIFSLVHLCVIYVVLLVILMMAVGLAFCRILECPLPER